MQSGSCNPAKHLDEITHPRDNTPTGKRVGERVHDQRLILGHSVHVWGTPELENFDFEVFGFNVQYGSCLRFPDMESAFDAAEEFIRAGRIGFGLVQDPKLGVM